MTRKPTRRDLLVVVARLQNLIGMAIAADNDRNKNRYAECRGIMNEAHELCVKASGFDDPVQASDKRSPWADVGGVRKEYI